MKNRDSADAAPANGRPPMEFNQHHADLLTGEIATCPESLASITKRLQAGHEGFPSIPTIYRWLRENAGFAEEYARCKSDQSDLLIDELLSIADDDSGDCDGSTSVQRAKLRVEARKWIASKLKPKAYGDRLDISAKIGHEHSVKALFDSIIPQPSLLCQDAILISEDSNPIK